MSRTIEAIGLISAILTTGSFIPGVISVWRLKPAPAKAISTPMYVILSTGTVGWLIYGIGIESRPVIWANTITLILSLSILFYKVKYG